MGVGPIKAVPKALKRAGMTMKDIDLIEFNEAFAAQVLAVVRELGMPEDKVNVNGGAIALGHPLGATGAKLTTQLVHELGRRGGGIGPRDDVHRRRDGRGGDFEVYAAAQGALIALPVPPRSRRASPGRWTAASSAPRSRRSRAARARSTRRPCR